MGLTSLRQLRAVLLLCLPAVLPAVLAAQDQPRVVRQLLFEGNQALDRYTLEAAIATTNSGAFARWWWLRWVGLGEKRTFDEVEFRRDVVRLVLLYRQSGYMNAVVDTTVVRRGKDVYITFRIHEGEPVRVTRFEIRGLDGILNVPRLRRDLPLQVGDPFDRFLFLASADTILVRLHNAGFPYANILRAFDSDADARRAELTLDALPGQRMRVGDVPIEGLREIDTATVRRMLSVAPGDIYRERDLFRSQQDLYGMEVFRSVAVVLADSSPPPDPTDTTVLVRVRLVEGPRQRLRVGAGYGSLDCFRLQSSWASHDFLGGGRTLTLSGRLSKVGVGFPFDGGLEGNVCPVLQDDFTSDTVNYNVGVTLQQPAFLSRSHTATFGVFAERRSEVQAYTRQAVGFNVGVTFNARRSVPVTLGYGYAVGHTNAAEAVYCTDFLVCEPVDRDFLRLRRAFAAVTLTGVRDFTNSPLDPTRGSMVTARLMHASRVVGSDTLYEFNRGEAELARYYPVGRRSVFAWRVRAGTILPQRITLEGAGVRFVPPEQRFYAGGPNSVRGYGRNELGPRVYVTRDTSAFEVQGRDTLYSDLFTAPTGGNSTFVLNAELRLPSPVFASRMRIGLFVDVGQVWERQHELVSFRGVRVTPGIGLRFATPLGPVRLDAAYNGYDREPGPLYFQDDETLTLFRESYQLGAPRDFLGRIVVQFAVGQAF